MRNKGFTLLEVLIAISILAGGVILLGQSWSGNLNRVRKANLYNAVGTLLERKIVEIGAKYRNKPLNDIPESEGGDFGSEYPEYSWTMKSRDLKFPDLSALMVGKEGSNDESMIGMIRQMTDIISKSIKEVRITVIVKGRKKDLEFSATDYVIDYATGLAAIPGGGG